MLETKFRAFNVSPLSDEGKYSLDEIEKSLEDLQAVSNSLSPAELTWKVNAIHSKLLDCAQHYGLDVLWCKGKSITVLICGRQVLEMTFASVEDLDAFMTYLEDIRFFNDWEEVDFNQPEKEADFLQQLQQRREEFGMSSGPHPQ